MPSALGCPRCTGFDSARKHSCDGCGAVRQITSCIGLARDTGHPSPLVTYACSAASAEEVCSPVNIAKHERAHPVPKIEVQREDAFSAHQALIGLHQQIVPLKCAHRNEAALDLNVVVGETSQRRCHENAIAYEGRGSETGATLYPDEIAVG